MDTILQTRTGDTIHNPTPEQMRESLAHLNPTGSGAYDTWLSANIGGNDWFVTALEDGSATLTIVDYASGTGEYKVYSLPNASRAHILEVWQELQRGDAEAIMGRPWQRTS
ncbi:MAG: hypothetical protein WCD37_02190 [Chloroflexia bacterium]